MTPPADPYRTLGLARGASLAEVKRAYRALAKVNHPDAAGPGALPRFLAIQAAYEQLLHAAPTKGPASRAAPKPPTRPSEADSDRADATHRAYSGRTRRTKTTGSRPRPSPGPDRPRPPADAGDDRDGPNKATLGSTSYDGADGQPFEPDWGGASWYGTTSGTYWTINPKEYADPRKHGPEYQARARRAARTRAGAEAGAAAAGSLSGTPDPEVADADPEATAADPTDATDGARPEAGTSSAPGGPAHTTSSWWDSTSAADGPPAGARQSDGRYPGAGAAAAAAATAAARASRADASADAPPPDLAAAATDLGRALTDERTARGRWRLVQALVGWLPIVLGLDWLVGELTGCGRYAATCTGSQSLITPLLALAVLALLLLVPMLASIAATATVAAVAAAIPTALVLSASGGAFEDALRAALLGFVLVLAWVAGVVFAVVRRIRRGTMPSG